MWVDKARSKRPAIAIPCLQISRQQTISCCCSSAAVAVVGCGLRPEQDNLISFSSANEKLLAEGLVGS